MNATENKFDEDAANSESEIWCQKLYPMTWHQEERKQLKFVGRQLAYWQFQKCQEHLKAKETFWRGLESAAMGQVELHRRNYQNVFKQLDEKDAQIAYLKQQIIYQQQTNLNSDHKPRPKDPVR